MRYRKRIIGIVILMIFFLQGCGNDTLQSMTQDEFDGKLKIAVSIIPEETFIREICGEKVDIITMIPPGMSPETYEPTPETMAIFQDADIYFAIGVPSEEANIFSKINEETYVVRLNEEVANTYDERFFEGGGRDPHIWLSLKRAKIIVEIMTEEISLLDEENRAYYEENRNKYLEKIEKTSLLIDRMFEESKANSFICYHPSFGYFAEEYGLIMYSLEEEGKEATPSHLQEIIDLAKEKSIHTVFYQTEVDSRQSEAFAEEIDGQAIALSPLAANYLDNMEDMAKKIVEGMK